MNDANKLAAIMRAPPNHPHKWRHVVGRDYKCRRCDLVVRADGPDVLGYVPTRCLSGAGDWLAVRLARGGMTKPRFLAAVNWCRNRVGLEPLPTCRCEERQRRLNAASRWILAAWRRLR